MLARLDSKTSFRFFTALCSCVVASSLSACLGIMPGDVDDLDPNGESIEVGDEEIYAEGVIPVEVEEIDESEFENDAYDGEPIAKSMTVSDLVDRWGCSTAPSMPLNAQIAEQMNCIEDGFFERIDDIPNIDLGPAANPFLQAPAADALRLVAARHPSSTFQVTSSWRSVVQQYILNSWEGACGIGVAASPGRSNHESGLAIDVPLSTTTTFRSALRDNSFRWYCDARNGGRSSGCRDTPHHDYQGGGADLRSRAVLAFQQLWNNEHPEDRIAEDGDYGPQTAARIRLSPLTGFEAGPTCATAPIEYCGDGACNGDESCDSCALDCGDCADAFCGDGFCDGDESCDDCPYDCGDCEDPCGDGVCAGDESCDTCAEDCGECSGCGVTGHGGSGDHGDDCSPADDEQWRCVFSERWGMNASQVCRDGDWMTFELDPRDCDACCGDYSSACRP